MKQGRFLIPLSSLFAVALLSCASSTSSSNPPASSSIEPASSSSVAPSSTDEPIPSSSSTGEPSSSSSSIGPTMSFPDQTTSVYGKPITIKPVFSKESETFTASYEGDAIRIDDNQTIVGLTAGTKTKVNLTSASGLTCSFEVTVSASTYKATSARDGKFARSEKWFDQPSVAPIEGLDDDFMTGMDISSMKALYDHGTKFYDENGNERALPYLLKDHGANWARLKLWVDPYTGKGTAYGGGESDLENTLWMAKECKHAGLKLLLDFHYSDYWTHPAQQILPKAWANVSSAEELAQTIRSYTKETLTTFQNEGCLPEMVQLGNEISSGSFLDTPGPDSETFSAYGEPTYLTGRGKKAFAFKAEAGSENMVLYLNAASQGVNDVSPSIKKVVHWAKGSQINATVINRFFDALSSVDYDYAGLSLYPYYCFPTGTDALGEILSGLELDKPWFVVETSYPFSGESYVWEDNFNVTQLSITNWTEEKQAPGITTMKGLYPFTPAGQASLIHDMTATVLNHQGLGMFYWEPAWVPNKDVGWAGKGSSCSWSNQGFFSYDGKMIGNLNVFNMMKGGIAD